MVNRVARTRLEGEMEYDFAMAAAGRRFQNTRLGNVASYEAVVLLRTDLRQPRFFQGGIVVGVKFIDRGDGVSPAQQRDRCMKAHEAGTTCQEDTHR